MQRFTVVAQCLKTFASRHDRFIKNVLTCGSVLSVGDCVAQKMQQHFQATCECTGKRADFDFQRTGRMFIIGVGLGPLQHHFYNNLDKFIPGHGAKVVAKKIVADQLLQSPIYYAGFLIGGDLLEGGTMQKGVEELKDKFLTVYLADCCVWPAAQFINFYFLPTHLRVLYVHSLSLFWSVFLSYVKHLDTPHYHYNPISHHRIFGSDDFQLFECEDSTQDWK